MTHTILVIDAEQAQCNLLCTVLREKLAYRTTGVSNGHEATSYVMTDQTPKPDLILFDVSTVVGGCETIANLKILTSHTPIVALVKYSDYESASAALSAGAQDFLCKPAAIERISATLRNALLLRDARREVERQRKERVIGADAGTARALGEMSSFMPFSLVNEDGNVRRMEELEAEAIRFAMQYYNGRMTEVARRLGIGRSTLYRKLNDLNIRQIETV